MVGSDWRVISHDALDAIDLLARPEVWAELQLTDSERFDWLPTNGGLVRDLAYSLLAPAAYLQLQGDIDSLHSEERDLYLAPTQHYTPMDRPVYTRILERQRELLNTINAR
jgi:hypothetical protein